MDELLLIDEEMREWINKYLTKQFIADPSEVPSDECRSEAKEILSHIQRHYATKIEEAKVRGLEAGKILGRKEVVEPSNELLEIGRKAIEDVLVEWRDSRLSEFNRGNGLVIREKDGRDSSIIRFGPESALRIGMKAMRQALKREK